jgi:hypothetical protein
VGESDQLVREKYNKCRLFCVVKPVFKAGLPGKIFEDSEEYSIFKMRGQIILKYYEIFMNLYQN